MCGMRTNSEIVEEVSDVIPLHHNTEEQDDANSHETDKDEQVKILEDDPVFSLFPKAEKSK